MFVYIVILQLGIQITHVFNCQNFVYGVYHAHAEHKNKEGKEETKEREKKNTCLVLKSLVYLIAKILCTVYIMHMQNTRTRKEKRERMKEKKTHVRSL
jgi:hypothetical protein